MDVKVHHVATLAALRAEQAVQILIPLVSLALLAALLSPQVRRPLGRAGTLVWFAVALLLGPTAIYAAGRM